MKTILVTGATGTLGKQLVPLLIKHRKKIGISRVRVFSRGEHRQLECQGQWCHTDRIDYLIGDVRDAERVEYACRNVIGVFHLAAFKSVDKAEYDPEECIKTNIQGTINVAKACIQNKVKKAVFTSTDKAVSPLNIYGATKLCAEKVWVASNVGAHKTRFAACRYGNVLGSNGSVIRAWRDGPPYKITDPEMTRFWMTQQKAAWFVARSYQDMQGGEIFIPKIKASNIVDVLRVVIGTKAGETVSGVEEIGIRPGEKMHEYLFTNDEIQNVTDCGEYFVRWPSHRLYPFKVKGERPEMDQFCSQAVEPYTHEELQELVNG